MLTLTLKTLLNCFFWCRVKARLTLFNSPSSSVVPASTKPATGSCPLYGGPNNVAGPCKVMHEGSDSFGCWNILVYGYGIAMPMPPSWAPNHFTFDSSGCVGGGVARLASTPFYSLPQGFAKQRLFRGVRVVHNLCCSPTGAQMQSCDDFAGLPQVHNSSGRCGPALW